MSEALPEGRVLHARYEGDSVSKYLVGRVTQEPRQLEPFMVLVKGSCWD